MLLIILCGCMVVAVQSERNCFTPTETVHAEQLLLDHFTAVGDRLKAINIDHLSTALQNILEISLLRNFTETTTKHAVVEGVLGRAMKLNQIRNFLEDIHKLYIENFNKTIETLTSLGAKSHIMDFQKLSSAIKQVVHNLKYHQYSDIREHIENHIPKVKRSWFTDLMEVGAVLIESYGRKRSFDVANAFGDTIAKTASALPNCKSVQSGMDKPTTNLLSAVSQALQDA